MGNKPGEINVDNRVGSNKPIKNLVESHDAKTLNVFKVRNIIEPELDTMGIGEDGREVMAKPGEVQEYEIGAARMIKRARRREPKTF